MGLIGTLIIIAGMLISVVYSVQILIIAFKESIIWGLAVIFIPFVNLLFLILFWDKCKSPFLKSLIAIPFLLVGMFFISMDS